LALVACLAGAGLAVAGGRARGPHDLDSYTDAQLKRDLDAELDDIYKKLGDPNGEYNLDALKTDILEALDDNGEGAEDEIDIADLNDEMTEAGTTLEDVVDDALAKADELSYRQASPAWRILPAGYSPHDLRLRFRAAGFTTVAQKRDKAAQASVAVRETERAIIYNIRRAK
jgi:hypothetical protein